MPKKKKKKKKAAGDGAPVEVKMHEKAQELSFEMNRFCMKDQLQRLTKENRDLKVSYEDLKRTSETSRKQQGDIQLFLNEKLDDQYNLIDELENKLIQIKTNHEHDKKDLLEEFKEKNDKLKTDLFETKSDLNIALDKLKGLENYRLERAGFKERTAQLEAELAMVKNETSRQLIQLDRQRVRSKEKMAQDLREAIQRTKEQAEADFESSYKSNTQKAMEQNKRMFADLKYQEKEARKLVSENKQLLERNASLSTELKMFKAVQSEFATKSQVYQKVIRKLQQQTDIPVSDRSSAVGPPVGGATSQKSAKSSRFTNQLQSLQRKIKKQQAMISQLKEQLKAQTDSHGDLLSFLLLSIEDVKKHPSIAGRDGTNPHSRRFHISRLPQSYVSLDLGEREQLLDYFVACVQSKSLAVAKSNFTANSQNHPSLSLPRINDAEANSGVRSIGVQTDVYKPRSPLRTPSMYSMYLERQNQEVDTFMTTGEFDSGLDFEVRGVGTALGRSSRNVVNKHRRMRGMSRTAPTTNYFL